MSDKDQLLSALQPILDFLQKKQLTHALRAELQAHFPIESDYMQTLKNNCIIGIQDGWLCPREGKDLRYGRLAKTSEATHHFGIDTVDMIATGPGHTHPNGEVDLCFALEGSPTFDGNPEGWTVYEKASWHIPTVSNGRMAIIYFLPNGAIAFGPKAS